MQRWARLQCNDQIMPSRICSFASPAARPCPLCCLLLLLRILLPLLVEKLEGAALHLDLVLLQPERSHRCVIVVGDRWQGRTEVGLERTVHVIHDIGASLHVLRCIRFAKLVHRIFASILVITILMRQLDESPNQGQCTLEPERARKYWR